MWQALSMEHNLTQPKNIGLTNLNKMWKKIKNMTKKEWLLFLAFLLIALILENLFHNIMEYLYTTK